MHTDGTVTYKYISSSNKCAQTALKTVTSSAILAKIYRLNIPTLLNKRFSRVKIF